jgi:threonine dehydratase
MPQTITIENILTAQQLIGNYVKATPVVESSLLNQLLGHQIIFKVECMQRTGSFKLRGASHMLAQLKKQGKLPKQILANSSGNHAQAVALAARLFGVQAKIFSTKSISAVKAAATQYYGAELLLFASREEADEQVELAAQHPDAVWVPPFNHPYIIAGQGTAALEALQQIGPVDGVFAPCGGGGLLSGTYIASRALCPTAEVVGAEPLAANDGANSLREGKIIRLKQAPDTLADGAATPAVGSYTFPILQQLDGFYEVDEGKIAYWTQWLQHLLKIHVEPTSAMSMEAVVHWLKNKTEKQKVLVILSGGNIDQQKMLKIWQNDYLQQLPSLPPDLKS